MGTTISISGKFGAFACLVPTYCEWWRVIAEGGPGKRTGGDMADLSGNMSRGGRIEIRKIM